jgi:hypothetical protein
VDGRQLADFSLVDQPIFGFRLSSSTLTPKQEVTMQTGLHALGWGLQRLSIAVGAVILAAILAYVTLVVAIVVMQGIAAFSQ